MNPFAWLKSLRDAGRDFVANLNALSATVAEINGQARRATGLKDPAALPGRKKGEVIAVAANKKE